MHIRRCWLIYAKFYWEEAEYIFSLISLIICYMIKCPSMFFVKLSFLKKLVEINHSDMRGLVLSENLYFFFAREFNFQYFFHYSERYMGCLIEHLLAKLLNLYISVVLVGDRKGMVVQLVSQSPLIIHSKCVKIFVLRKLTIDTNINKNNF